MSRLEVVKERMGLVQAPFPFGMAEFFTAFDSITMRWYVDTRIGANFRWEEYKISFDELKPWRNGPKLTEDFVADSGVIPDVRRPYVKEEQGRRTFTFQYDEV